MKRFCIPLSAALFAASFAFPITSKADTTVVVPGGSTQNGNFGSPGLQGTNGYTVYTTDDGTNFTVQLTSAAPISSDLHFSNLYIDTIASTPNTGSNLGFEVTNSRAFIPGVSGYYALAGTGYSFTDLTNAAGDDVITAIIPNSFFLTDPLNMGFAKTPDGSLVSVHLSQTFGYAVAGGSANYAAPVELGDATVSAALAPTPEPSSLILLGTGISGIAGIARRKLRRA